MNLNKNSQPNAFVTAIAQVCIVTKDFDSTVRFMTSVLGIGPFKVWNFENPVLFNQTFLGMPAKWTMRLGVALIGGIQWEIIQPIAEPSLYAEFLEKYSDGPHHILLETKGTSFENAVKHLEEKGFTNKQSAMLNIPTKIGALTFPAIPNFLRELFPLKFCYLESEKLSGMALELAHLPLGLSTSTALRIGKADFFIPLESSDVMHRLPNAFIDKITKISFVTPDLFASVNTWTTMLGIKPWQIIENSTVPLKTGENATSSVHIAWIFLGDILLELIEPVSKDSPHERLLTERGPGISTIGVCSHSLNLEHIVALMQSLDMPILMQGIDYNGHEFVTIDASKGAHVWIEFTSQDKVRQ